MEEFRIRTPDGYPREPRPARVGPVAAHLPELARLAPRGFGQYRRLVRVEVGTAAQRTTRRSGYAEGGIVKPDAWSNRKDMSPRNEERRRAESALERAVDVNPDVATDATRAAICAYVDLLVDDGLLPEAVVIAVKKILSRTASLHRLEPEAREEMRSALVSACIQRYFARRLPDDVRIATAPPLRLVRAERDAMRRSEAPDASV